MWKQGVAAVFLLLFGGVCGFVAGQSLSSARYSAMNVGGGRIIRVNTRSGETVLFNADCMAKAPALPKGYAMDSCPS